LVDRSTGVDVAPTHAPASTVIPITQLRHRRIVSRSLCNTPCSCDVYRKKHARPAQLDCSQRAVGGL